MPVDVSLYFVKVLCDSKNASETKNVFQIATGMVLVKNRKYSCKKIKCSPPDCNKRFMFSVKTVLSLPSAALKTALNLTSRDFWIWLGKANFHLRSLLLMFAGIFHVYTVAVGKSQQRSSQHSLNFLKSSGGLLSSAGSS